MGEISLQEKPKSSAEKEKNKFSFRWMVGKRKGFRTDNRGFAEFKCS